jgi:ketosteroid isomerase-like protein
VTGLDAHAVLDRLHATLGAYYAGAADQAAVRELFTPDVAWHVPGHNAIAGDYQGVDEVLTYFARRRDHAAGTFEMHPRDTLIGSTEFVGVLTEGTATIGGGRHRWSTVGIYRLAGDQIAECWLLPLNSGEFDRVWAYRDKR